MSRNSLEIKEANNGFVITTHMVRKDAESVKKRKKGEYVDTLDETFVAADGTALKKKITSFADSVAGSAGSAKLENQMGKFGLGHS